MEGLKTQEETPVLDSDLERFLDWASCNGERLPPPDGEVGWARQLEGVTPALEMVESGELSQRTAFRVLLATSAALARAQETGQVQLTSELQAVLRNFTSPHLLPRLLELLQHAQAIHIGAEAAAEVGVEIEESLKALPTTTVMEGLAVALRSRDVQDLAEEVKPVKESADLQTLLVKAIQALLKSLEVPAELAGDTAGAQADEASAFISSALPRAQVLLALLEAPALASTRVRFRKDPVMTDLLLISAPLTAASARWMTPELQQLAAGVLQAVSSVPEGLGKLVEPCLGDVLPRLQAAIRSSDVQADESQLRPVGQAPLGVSILAAMKMQWLVCQLVFPALGPHWHLALPCVLSSLDHYSLQVRLPGLRAMRHLVANLNPTELRWFADVAMDTTCKLLIGCEDELWPEAVPAVVELCVQIEGRNPRGKWYGQVLAQLIAEGERQSDSVERRLVCLHHISPLLTNLGLLVVGHFHRLMPLLLFWLHSHDDQTRLLTLNVLLVVISSTWPRMPAHARRLREELEATRTEASGRKAEKQLCEKVEAALELLSLACSCQPGSLSQKVSPLRMSSETANL